MKKRAFAVAIVWVMVLAGAFPLEVGASDKKSQYDVPVAQLNFVVVKDYNGKPVRNAGVVMHTVGKHDKQDRGGLELKTDADGKASFDGIPYGKLRVQVLAPGFQTFGGDYDVNQPAVEITIKLKRPEGQYSIYDDHQNNKKEDKTAPPAPDPNPKPQ
ncbi:MAG TPA: carboxypeptidase-like regulatory domain-containing protein [Terriglobales bacterium]|nr:carboxypeptidase-like regulatory domain-containing protein [Terriglobales bacterium]